LPTSPRRAGWWAAPAPAGRWRSGPPTRCSGRPSSGRRTIIGEAVARLAGTGPESLARLPPHRQIIALRRILVHAHGRVDAGVIADFVARDVPEPQRVVDELLGGGRDPGSARVTNGG
jgi:hypothetical protein